MVCLYRAYQAPTSEKGQDMWQMDRTTSGTSRGDGNPRGTRGGDRTNGRFWPTKPNRVLKWLLVAGGLQLPLPTNLGQVPKWLLEVFSDLLQRTFGQLQLWAFLLLILMKELEPRNPESTWFIYVFAADILITILSTRACWLAARRSRFLAFLVLLPAAAFSMYLLPIVPLGVSGRLDWFLAIIPVSGIVAVPLFLVATGFISLPRSFWSFTIRQLAGFVTATLVLLIFLGAYGRRENLFTPHSSVWELTKSFGPLLVQGVKNLLSGETLGAGAGTADVLAYMLGWIVFVLIAGVEVSIVANRASEEMAKIESDRRRMRRPPARPMAGWHWLRRGAD